MNQNPKDSYKYGESTDISTGTIDIYRKSNPNVVSKTISLTDAAVKVTGLNTTIAGANKTATVTYEETYGNLGKIQKTTTYNYSVSDNITGMNVSGSPKTDYEYGDEIDLTGIEISIKTESNPNGTTLTLPNSHIKIDGFDTTTEGTKTITIKYVDDDGNVVKDQNGKSIEYQYTINVTDPIISIAMDSSSMPKTNYLKGEKLDVTNGKVIITKKSTATTGKTFIQNLTPNMISGFDSSKEVIGQQLTVTLLDSSNNPILDSNNNPIKTSYKINVTDPISSIKVNNTKTNYKYGQQLDLSKITMDINKVTGEKITNQPVKEEMISGYNPKVLGKQTVTLTYGTDKNGNPVTTTFEVNVEDYVKTIAVKGEKTEYKLGENLDLTQGKVQITMASGTPTTDVALNDQSVTVDQTSYDGTKQGSYVLKVSYGVDISGNPVTTTFTVKVNDYVTGRTIIAPTKTIYNYGDSLDLSTGYIEETWKSSNTSKIKLTLDMITEADGSPLNMKPTNYDNTNKITKKLKITYTADNSTITKDYQITIINDVKGITIKELPKTEYNCGDTLDKTIGSIEVTRADGTKEEVKLTDSRITITKFDTSKEGKIEVKIEFAENGKKENTTYFIDVKDNIKSITMKDTPKTEYKYGEKLDVTGGTITVVRNSGKTETVDITESMIKGYNPNKLGEQLITVTYKDKTTTYKVNVKDYLKDINIVKPNDLVYKIGENIKLAGGKVIPVMASGISTTPIDMTSAEVQISGFDSSSEGAKLIKVTYKGFTKTFGITVVDPLSNMIIKTLPDKTDYRYGEELDVTGGTIEIIKESGTSKVINITKDMVSGYNPKKLGSQTLTVTYEGLTQQFIVNVEDYISKIEIKKPQKTEYEYGESLDLTGGKVSIIMASGKVEETVDMTASMISGYDKTKEGIQTIKVEYKGLQGNFQVNVIDKIKGITLNSEPNKINYKYGENIDVTGATIKVIKSSGIYTIPVTNDMISGYNPQNVGIQVITITYEGFTAKFMVSVAEQETITEPKDDDNKTDESKTDDSKTDDNKTNNNETNINEPNKTTNIINKNIEEDTKEEPTKEETSETQPIEENNNQNGVGNVKEENPTKTPDGKEEAIDGNKKIAGIIGTIGLLILLILLLFRRNVKIYIEEDGEFVLGGLDKITKKHPELNIDKYLDGETYNNKVKVRLNDSISEKMDGKEIEIKHRGQKVKYKVKYNDEPYEIELK